VLLLTFLVDVILFVNGIRPAHNMAAVWKILDVNVTTGFKGQHAASVQRISMERAAIISADGTLHAAATAVADQMAVARVSEILPDRHARVARLAKWVSTATLLLMSQTAAGTESLDRMECAIVTKGMLDHYAHPALLATMRVRASVFQAARMRRHAGAPADVKKMGLVSVFLLSTAADFPRISRRCSQ